MVIYLGLYLVLLLPPYLVLALVPPAAGSAMGLWLGVFLLIACFAMAWTVVRLNPLLRLCRPLRLGLLLGSLGFGFFLAWLLYQGEKGAGWVALAATANLLVFANLAGSWLAEALKRPAELVLICLVMSLADLCSILKGPTRQIAGELATYYQGGGIGPVPPGDLLLIKIAVPGAGQLLPVFGVADWIMVALLAAAVERFAINDNLVGVSLGRMGERGRMGCYIPVAAAGLAMAVLLAQQLGLFLPALPVVAVVFLSFALIRYPGVRRLTRQDWSLVAVSLALATGVLVVPGV